MLRSVNCGELGREDRGKKVRIAGWVRKIRDHGEIVFIDLWDRYGTTQIVVPSEKSELKERVRDVGLEWVILIEGEVRMRPHDMVNPDLATGEIEVEAQELNILNPSEIPPFVVKEKLEAEKELRLKYRYLELRRKSALDNFILRHKLMQTTRQFLNRKDFLEVETPILAKSTPEGARDFLVPSRMKSGNFYSLAQSPQLYKQILMVAGFDKYYQFARCFRDEDMRGDRQLEHTQIDLEMAYAERKDIYTLCEGLMVAFLNHAVDIEPEIPFPRLKYREAIEKYGTDKPDLRIPLIIEDYTDIAQRGDFGIFNGSDMVRGIKIERILSRSDIDRLESIVKKEGAGGLLYLSREKGEYRSPFAKYFENLDGFGVKNGETLLLISGGEKEIMRPLGVLRLKLGEEFNLINKGWEFIWITDFPLFEWNEEEKRWAPAHHIFTQPIGDIEGLENYPASILGKQYDLVLNGVELGSGSIRNHNPEIQRRLLRVLGMSDEEIERKFGFLLRALSYGAPPHGGIALGFDRICMLLSGLDSITETITFPKTLAGVGLMEGSPSPVPEEDLSNLGLEIKKDERKDS